MMGALLTLFLSIPAWAQTSIKSFAVYKMFQSETQFKGGVSGTAFFIDHDIAVTAHHVINSMPRNGKIWLLNQDFGSLSLDNVRFEYLAERDLTYIYFDRDVVTEDWIFLGRDSIDTTSPIYSEGYKVGTGKVQIKFHKGNFSIAEIVDLPFATMQGQITWLENVTVQSDDLKLNRVDAIRMTLPLYVGMSGGPLLQDGKVIGFNSFGTPVDAPQKTESWAIPLN